MSAGQILVVGGIALFVAAFLNSRTLLDMAERQPYGWQRTVAVGVTKPLHTLSRWTGLAKPGQVVDDVRGRNAGSEDSFDALDHHDGADRVVSRGCADHHRDVRGFRPAADCGGGRDHRPDDRAGAGDRRAAAHADARQAAVDVGRRRLDGGRGRRVAGASRRARRA